MAFTPYDNAEIIEVVLEERRFFGYFKAIAFGSTVVTDDERIGFDEITEARGVTPLVLPMEKGQVLADQGYTTKFLRPAYAKELATVRMNATKVRQPGESIFSGNSGRASYAEILAQQGVRLYNRWERLGEYLGSQLLRTGKVAITTEGYGSYELDFERKAELTSVLTGAATWTKAKVLDGTVSPISDCEDIINKMSKPCTTITFSKTAFSLFKLDPQYKELMHKDFEQHMGTASLVLGPTQKDQDRSHKVVGYLPSLGVTLVTYDETLDIEGPTGDKETYDLLAPNEIVFTPEATRGIMGYGVIQNAKAEFKGRPLFFSNWMENNPGVPYLMLETAIVPFHTEINSTAYMKVA